MAKNKTQVKKKPAKKSTRNIAAKEPTLLKLSQMNLLPEEKDKYMPYESKIDNYLKQVMGKFSKHILGMCLLPPPKEFPKHLKPEEIQKIKDRISVLMLIDDSEPSGKTKQELHNSILQAVDKMAVDIDPKLYPEPLLMSSLWQNMYDAKYDLLNLMVGAPIFYDKGMIASLRLTEYHKRLVMQKFEKYIVSYVLVGSLPRGKASPESDVDVLVIIDDTDVKKMTRAELKDKLRGIIIGLGMDAQDRTGVRKPFNIQVYILTDTWESIKEAHPVIFTFLRDGVPLADKGVFMPWKQLLKMGRIKPSPEAIEAYMKQGEQWLDRVGVKLREIAIEEFYWSTVTPSQAALMLVGVAPPAPNDLSEVMVEEFVKKRKLLKKEDMKPWEKILHVRKELEHRKKKDVTGKEIDELVVLARNYLKHIRGLFDKLEKEQDKDSILRTYHTLVTTIRDILIAHGVEKVPEKEVIALFEEELVHTGLVPSRFLARVKDIFAAKERYDHNKLKKTDVAEVRKLSGELLRHLVEHLQRSRTKTLERAKVRIKQGTSYGEVLLLGDHAYITPDINSKERTLQKASVNKDGSLGPVTEASLEEYEEALAQATLPPHAMIKHTLFDSLKKIFGDDVEVIVGL